jgi:hypothetical protein
MTVRTGREAVPTEQERRAGAPASRQAAPARPSARYLDPGDVLRLQRTAGNQAVQRMLAPTRAPCPVSPAMQRADRAHGPYPRTDGHRLQRTINVIVDTKSVAVNENSVGSHKLSIQSEIARLYPQYDSETHAKIWARIKTWAEDDFEDYPSEGSYLSYATLIEEAVKILDIPPPPEAEAVERIPQAMLTLKRCWVRVSMDPTEGHAHSISLDRVSDELRGAVEALGTNSRLTKAMNLFLPGVLAITDRYLVGGYGCHQDAARDVRPLFAAANFASMCEGMSPTRSSYVVRAWNELCFSTRI